MEFNDDNDEGEDGEMLVARVACMVAAACPPLNDEGTRLARSIGMVENPGW